LIVARVPHTSNHAHRIVVLPPGKQPSAYPDNYFFVSIKTKNAFFDFSGVNLFLHFFMDRVSNAHKILAYSALANRVV
jgi:hypothetical protein